MGSNIVKVRDVIPAGCPQPYGFSLTNPPSGAGKRAADVKRAMGAARLATTLYLQAHKARKPKSRDLNGMWAAAQAAMGEWKRVMMGGAS